MRHGFGTHLMACGAMVMLALPACRAKPKNFDNENDELRRRVAALEADVERLTAERNEARAKLAEAARAAAEAGGMTEEAREALPRCAGVRLGRLSGPVDDDGSPGFDAVDFYVQPFDGRQRFIPIAGTLAAEATLIPKPDARAGATPRTLGRVTLSPSQLREAYRSSPLGTHYSVRLPLDPPNAPLDGTVVLTVAVTDALTGQVFEARQAGP